MPITVGHIETANGAKYLAQLCKHFAHKIDASYSGNHGRAAFIFGLATMTADENGLTVHFDVNNPMDLGDAQNVIDKHLERFAFRETITGMVWQNS